MLLDISFIFDLLNEVKFVFDIYASNNLVTAHLVTKVQWTLARTYAGTDASTSIRTEIRGGGLLLTGNIRLWEIFQFAGI